jgi:hypothetical protein
MPLFHTIRFTKEETWQPWGDVVAAAGDPSDTGVISAVACAEHFGDLHVLALGDVFPPLPRYRLHHAIRRTTALTWQPFHNVEATAAGRLPHFPRALAATHCAADLHVVVLAYGDAPIPPADICHTIRFARELVWQPFGKINKSRAGNPSVNSTYGSIGCAEVDGDLHVVVTGVDHTNRTAIFHTIRFTRQFDWQPFGNVNAAAESDKSFFGVACARVLGDLHVVACDTEGVLWHTIRFTSARTWQPFRNISEAAGRPHVAFNAVACAEVGGDLHVIGLTTGRELLHTIRFSTNPLWQPFGSLTAVLGPFPQENVHLDNFACSRASGDLHVCVSAS